MKKITLDKIMNDCVNFHPKWNAGSGSPLFESNYESNPKEGEMIALTDNTSGYIRVTVMKVCEKCIVEYASRQLATATVAIHPLAMGI